MISCMRVPAEYADITAELSRRAKKLYLKCGLWCAAVVLLEYVYLWRYFAERISVPGSAVIAVFLLCCYPVRQGIVRHMTDRGWEGTVRDIKKRAYIHFTNLWNRFYSGMTTRIEGHLYMYGRAGRSEFLEKHLPIKRKFILRDGGTELPYRIGDTVRRFRGCAYPVIVTRKSMDGYPPRICVFCGKAEENRERKNCDFCGFSLILLPETVQFVEYGIDITDTPTMPAAKL